MKAKSRIHSSPVDTLRKSKHFWIGWIDYVLARAFFKHRDLPICISTDFHIRDCCMLDFENKFDNSTCLGDPWTKLMIYMQFSSALKFWKTTQHQASSTQIVRHEASSIKLLAMGWGREGPKAPLTCHTCKILLKTGFSDSAQLVFLVSLPNPEGSSVHTTTNGSCGPRQHLFLFLL